MARVAGVDLPKGKRVDVALTYVFGIGKYIANKILSDTGIEVSKRVKDLTDEEVNKLNSIISKDFKVEGDLRREVQDNIKRYISIGSYRGYRHRRNLPVRGQRTKTNARTRRGRRKTVGSAAKVAAAAAKAPEAKA